MGRAMLIIVTGVLISVGITQVGLFGNLSQMDRHSVSYAEGVQASNTAHAAIELAIDRLKGDPNWRTGGSPHTFEIDGAFADVEVETVSPETLSVAATSVVNSRTRTVRKIFREQDLHFVPEFKAALSIMTDLFDFGVSGSAFGITGNNSEDNCPAVPGVTIPSSSSQDKISPYSGGISGDPPIAIDPDSDFDDVSKLIKVLENQPGTNYLPSGNYKGELGSPESPGVYFVTGDTKISGNTEGYGIMVVRKNATIDIEGAETTDDGSLDLRGTFDFHGLVIFENAWSLNASGTPGIHGSIMVGTTNDWETNIGIELNGTPDFNYSCEGQRYAQLASSNVNSHGKQFTVISVRE